MKIHCELLDYRFDLPARPERIVCLTSGITEALFAMGCGERVGGVSTYCARYVPDLKTPVAGDYLKVDPQVLKELRPDLLLVTTGVQRTLGLKLAREGLPVYALPLPNSYHGIQENILAVAALLDAMPAGRRLIEQMESRAAGLRRRAPSPRPRVYIELWFGKHLRTAGGRTFIHDIVELAGGEPLLGAAREGYLEPNFEAIAQLRPDVVLGFSEPEFPVDFRELFRQRGWDRSFSPKLIESTVERGRNIIHDGPSLLETAEWLAKELQGIGSGG
jgi:ABC-type Fe3+-hydroxamate transport system substrate-binding protein